MNTGTTHNRSNKRTGNNNRMSSRTEKRGGGRSATASSAGGSVRGSAGGSVRGSAGSSARGSAGSYSGSSASSGTPFSVVASRIAFIAITGLLLLFGLVMLYSASSITSYAQFDDYSAVFSKQVIFVAIGVVCALIIALIPYEKFSFNFSLAALVFTIPLLAIALIFGDDALGARRWLDIGFTNLQPSEFAKIALMLVMVHLVERCRTHGYSRALIFFMIVACAIPIGLIVAAPDLGTTIIAVVGILAVLWFGGIPRWVVGLLGLAVLIFGAIAIVGTGFRSARMVAWLDPTSDPLGDGYQILNSYYAFGEGGILGVGLGLSRQKFHWLPMSENDFLFAIVGEELGLVGALLVALLFMGLVIASLRIARNAPTATGSMIAGASGVIIGSQAFLNMLVVVGGLPTTGKPLPFFSAGGSSIIATMILVGLILSVSRQSQEANVYDFRREQFEVVDGGGAFADKARSVLSRLPNPAAAVAGAVRPKPTAVRTQGVRQQSGRPQTARSAGSRASQTPHTRVPLTQHTRTAAAQRAQTTAAQSSLRRVPRVEQTKRVEHTRRVDTEKVIPISRGRAEKSMREAQSLRQSREARSQTTGAQRPRSEGAISMSSLRRNRVRRSGGGVA